MFCNVGQKEFAWNSFNINAVKWTIDLYISIVPRRSSLRSYYNCKLHLLKSFRDDTQISIGNKL